MNFLGHFYLAQPYPHLIVGNLMGEFVHGAIAPQNIPEAIKIGVQMHRAIDSFTDQNEDIKFIQQFYKPVFGRYASVMSDIAIDYFLANDDSIFNQEQPLPVFSQNIYTALKENISIFSPRGKKIIEHMSQENWLTRYAVEEGITKSFHSIVKRAHYLNPSATAPQAYHITHSHYNEILPYYKKFIAAIVEHTSNYRQDIS